MSTVVVSGRVDDLVRQKADVAIRKAGLTPSDIIQNVWGAIAETGEVPAVAKLDSGCKKGEVALERLEKFLDSLPSINPVYANWEDDEILALEVRDYA